MTFKKVKGVATKATPGVERMERAIEVYGKFRKSVMRVRLNASYYEDIVRKGGSYLSEEKYWSEMLRDVKAIRKGLDTLLDEGVITEETYGKLIRYIENAERQTEAEKPVGVFQMVSEFQWKMDCMSSDMAIWARAPKAVGTKRKVME